MTCRRTARYLMASKILSSWLLWIAVLCASSVLPTVCKKTNQTHCDNEGAYSLFKITRGDSAITYLVLVCEYRVLHRICDQQWTVQDAMVACRELGFTGDGAEPFTDLTSDYSGDYPNVSSTVPICSGSEDNLSNCETSTVPGQGTCDAATVAAVSCLLRAPSVPTSNIDTTATTNIDTTATKQDILENPTPVPSVSIATTPFPTHTSTKRPTNVQTTSQYPPASTQVLSPTTSPHSAPTIPPTDPTDPTDSTSVLSSFHFGLFGGGVALIIGILVGITILCAYTLRVRYQRRNMVSSPPGVAEKGPPIDRKQLGWTNPTYDPDSPEHIYAELTESTAQQLPPSSHFYHQLTPESSTSGSPVLNPHVYEDLAHGKPKPVQPKPVQPGDPYQQPVSTTNPVKEVENQYSTLKREPDTYATLEPHISGQQHVRTSHKIDLKAPEEHYSHLNHSRHPQTHTAARTEPKRYSRDLKANKRRPPSDNFTPRDRSSTGPHEDPLRRDSWPYEDPVQRDSWPGHNRSQLNSVTFV